jgi:hypothetical protein
MACREKASLWRRRCHVLQRIADGMEDRRAQQALSQIASQWERMAHELEVALARRAEETGQLPHGND